MKNGTDNYVELSEELFLGRGAHKATYVHPEDDSICVKITFKWPDEDVKKELRYRSVLGKKADDMPLLTKYYGKVKTNLGTGYLYERITDFDGGACRNLNQYIEECHSTEQLVGLLLNFRKELFRCKYVVAGVNPDNFLVQRISSEKYLIKIVDDLGTGAFIPILYYSDKLLRKRINKYWRMLVHELEAKYSDVITPEVACRLMKGVNSMGICLLSKGSATMARLGEALAETGNRVALVTTAADWQEGVKSNIPPPKTKILHLHKSLSWLECLLRLVAISWKTDSLLLEGMPGFAMPAVLFARMFRNPIVALISEEDLQDISRSTLGLAGRLLTLCDYAVVSNETVKQQILSQYGLMEREVIVLPFEAKTNKDEIAAQVVLQLQSLLSG